MPSRLLVLLVAGLGAWALLLALTGGVDLRHVGIGFSSRDPLRPALLAFILLCVYSVASPQAADAHLTRLRAWTTRWAPLLAIGLAVYTCVIGLRFGIFVASGADAYGYVSQADLWLKGDLTIEQPLARELPWNDADWTLAPLGYRPAVSGGAIVPVYAPGLPMLMAGARLACGDCGPYLVVPLLGALLVWLTYRLGERVATRNVGLAAAALMASSPAFLVMLVSPMSDVPVAAFLVGALGVTLSRVRGRAFWTGLTVSAALMVRPNLVPLAAIFLAFLVAWETDWRQRFRTAAAFGLGILPAVAAIALLHTHLYGAPWKSGYGDLEGLYAWRFALTNIPRYTRWLVETHTPLILFFIVPIVVSHRLDRDRRDTTRFLAAFGAGVWLCYLFYIPFEEWSYLRFVLSAFPPLLLLAIAGWDLAARRLRPLYRNVVMVGVAGGVIGYQVSLVQDSYLLRYGEGESAYISVARHVAETLPENAVVLSMMHSGSLRFYAGRLTLRYDLLDPAWWPRALDVLTAKGYRPYVLLTDFEEPKFRRRFGLSDAPDAPGLLIAEVEGSGVRLYDPLRRAGVGGEPARILPRVAPPCRWW